MFQILPKGYEIDFEMMVFQHNHNNLGRVLQREL